MTKIKMICIAFIFSCFLFSSCSHYHKIASDKTLVFENDINDTIYNSLSEKINFFINEVDEYHIGIILITFYKQGEECFVKMKTALCYPILEYKGYIERNNYLLAFYAENQICFSDLVKEDKLHYETPEKYIDCERADILNFDTHSYTFKIINKDSIVFISRGW